MSDQAKRIGTAVVGAILAVMTGADSPVLTYTIGVVATWIAYQV